MQVRSRKLTFACLTINLKLFKRFANSKHYRYTDQRVQLLLKVVILFFFLAFDFCQFCLVFRFYHPNHQILSFILFSYIISWEKPVFPFLMLSALMLSAKQGNYLYHSLEWRGPWLGIEPGISRTRSQHSTTRLLRRRCCDSNFEVNIFQILKVAKSETYTLD